jgi:hypothetical protein
MSIHVALLWLSSKHHLMANNNKKEIWLTTLRRTHLSNKQFIWTEGIKQGDALPFSISEIHLNNARHRQILQQVGQLQSS